MGYTPLNQFQLLLLNLQAEEKANGSDRVQKDIMDLLINGMDENITPEKLAEKIHLIYFKEMEYLINR